MKKQIRRGVFETNSSSVHSLTMCMESDYDRWQKDHFYTREEAIAFEKTDKYIRKDFDWSNEEEVNEILHENKFYDYEYFWNKRCEYYETFEETMTTPNGERVVAFGYYGDN